MSWLGSFGKTLIICSIAFALVQSGLAYNIIDAVRYQDIGELDLQGVVENIISPSESASTTPFSIPKIPSISDSTPSPTPTEAGYYDRIYEWNYKGTTWQYSVSIPKSVYNYYKKLDHASKDYPKYISDEWTREDLSDLATTFRDGGSKKGYSDSENVMNVIAFVQSLPYTSDSVTTGHDEYPRYPIETLVDNGGDCEDTALLTAGILREMGYGVVLLALPGHMAVGVKGGSGVTGTYYLYNNVKYYYLETTGNGWKIGQIPDAYRNTKARVIPL
ncbi:MAG: hypothetical protein EOM62_17345 [Bacteroidia bacterium]|jgi:hypothetical protein|nr:hypothetical protein [Bacteroidia bacterium]